MMTLAEGHFQAAESQKHHPHISAYGGLVHRFYEQLRHAINIQALATLLLRMTEETCSSQDFVMLQMASSILLRDASYGIVELQDAAICLCGMVDISSCDVSGAFLTCRNCRCK